MSRCSDDYLNDNPFLVKPGTTEYDALSFLVRNREERFTPAEIGPRIDISETSASKTMIRLFENELIERSQGSYYVDPDCADKLKQRLDSVDAAMRLHDVAPEDDIYAETVSWETESINSR